MLGPVVVLATASTNRIQPVIAYPYRLSIRGVLLADARCAIDALELVD